MAALANPALVADPGWDVLPDGVHIGLDEEPYFAQHALGSSDIVKLWKFRHGWWWSSRWNPDRKPRVSTKEQAYGKAAHVVVLEGLETYEARYAVEPRKPAGALTTAKECRVALEAARFSTRGTSGWVADDWFSAMETNLPHVPVWPNMLAEFRREAGERPVIAASEDRMLRIMHDALMGNPALAKLFGVGSGFPPLAEVSVLYTDPTGVRRRWRFDRLFPAFTLDLKTLGNWSGRPLRFAVGDHIGQGGYDIQRADYDVGRGKLYDFVRDGFRVFGGTIEQRHFLKRIVEANAAWDWVWLFYQKAEASGRAPVLFPVYDDNDSELKTYGRAKLQNALAFYRQMVTDFGLERPWTYVEELHYTAEGTGPRITLPHWIGMEEPPEDAGAYAEEEPTHA